MSLAESFNIVVHSTNIDEDRSGPHPVTIEYKSIGMRHPLEVDEEIIQKCKEDKDPLTRIHLTHATLRDYRSCDYMNWNIDVLETVEEIDGKIEEAQIAHIKKMQKLRVAVL